MDTSTIFASLRASSNPKKAAEMSAYMRDQFTYLGISTPKRRKLSRPFLKSLSKTSTNWQLIFECWEQPEREFKYLALDYLTQMKSCLTADDIVHIRTLAITESWWDTIDGLDTIVGDIALRYPKVNKTLVQWSTDKNIWLRRIAIDHQLLRKEQTDTKLLEQILTNNFGQTEFFINKAIGWSLRAYSKTNPRWVQDFLERHSSKMAPLSIKEAKKYINTDDASREGVKVVRNKR